ncbi:hypothetical protein TPHA_0B01880 [Tetrapisispora phaffii CBS 4417]|uniref:threonine--tRNA ligase n=1 Tax=Tetrapisispora phaffii (strain ATCC 24235 / CBS 4417 / NBRC 1672 / NRRL Y-8282 / UCD 70-5) TaxID=1071381 RepID=G8BPC9_TETPH|nr:hypothetical protein TPHA_0B01880 [Tetrapisispora phaffii CBS 4417]CCE61860.1 hypothetical protein TPHA_0B01880 [Tetrapisispora phaffii CBS 4417]
MLRARTVVSKYAPKHISYSTKATVVNDSKNSLNISEKKVDNILNEVNKDQKLYMNDPVSPGSIFFLPDGTKIFNKLVEFMKLQQEYKFGFKEVITPLIYKKSLWEQSGHWINYKDDMFRVESQDKSKEEYGLKPMNCPGHCMIFQHADRSYSELPMRLSDYSPLHRNEASGALSGLTRVRKFHQDDGHIFCTPEQVGEEIAKCIKLIDLCYKRVFTLNRNSGPSYTLEVSTRPEKYIGELKTWDHAEDMLKNALESLKKDYSINEGDGAFYGPKIDIKVTDHKNKSHQVATIQLDFQLPERFKLRYKDKDNTYKRPIMIHRAVFGSLERFIAMLVETNEGSWPFWLNPRQAMIIPVNTKSAEQVKMAKEVHLKLKGEDIGSKNDFSIPVPNNGYHFNVDIDLRSEPIGRRIKDAINKKYSYIITVGDNEVKSNIYSIRNRQTFEIEALSYEKIFEQFKTLQTNYS